MSANVKRLFNPHIRHGIKVGLASVLAYFMAEVIGLPYAYWTVITTVIVMQMYVADSIRMIVYRFTGTALGAFIGIIMILVFPPTHMWTLVAIFIGAAFCAYCTRYNERFRMAAITLSIVFLTSVGSPDFGIQDRIVFGLYRVAEIGVGVLSAFLVSVLVWPSRAGAALREQLQKQYTYAARHYELLMGHFLQRQTHADPDLLFSLAGETKVNAEMFHKVFALERRLFRDDVALLSLQVTVFRSVVERLQSMLVLLNEVEGEGFDIIMAPEMVRLMRATSAALGSVGAGKPHDSHELAQAVLVIEERFSELRMQGVTERFGVRRLFQVLGFINAAQHLGEDVLEVINRQEFAEK